MGLAWLWMTGFPESDFAYTKPGCGGCIFTAEINLRGQVTAGILGQPGPSIKLPF